MLVRSEGKREPGKVYIDSVHSDPGIELAGRQSGENTSHWYVHYPTVTICLSDGDIELVSAHDHDKIMAYLAKNGLPVPWPLPVRCMFE